MATQILAAADTAANSADVVVTSNLTVCLKGVVDGGEIAIQLKDDAGVYQTVGRLTAQEPATVIAGPGTYRFSRKAGKTLGVFSG